jgi:putative transposase
MAKTETNAIEAKLIDELLKDCKTSNDILGESGLIKQLIKSLLKRALEGEMNTHLGYEKHDSQGDNTGNSRNGYSNKILKGENGNLEIEVPRDRNSTFEPKIVSKGQTRFEGFDEKILLMYARGMTTRDIQAQLQEMYGVEVSATLISNVTESVMEEVKLWQSRPLEKVYPIVYMDALVIKVKQEKQIINKAFYLALGINMQGQKDLLGIWVSENEGAKFWLSVLTELKNRGIEDIFIACVDGLTGFPEAITTAYPKTKVQLCIVHLVRNALRYVSWKEKKEVVKDLKQIYGAATLEEAEIELENFSKKWDYKYAMISKTWVNRWENITPFFSYPPEIRKVIYTTNAIESLNMQLRKVLKNKRFFPTDESAFKQIYLALKNISKKWTMPLQDWGQALNHFHILFEQRCPLS